MEYKINVIFMLYVKDTDFRYCAWSSSILKKNKISDEINYNEDNKMDIPSYCKKSNLIMRHAIKIMSYKMRFDPDDLRLKDLLHIKVKFNPI